MRTKPHIAKVGRMWYCGLTGPNSRTAAFTPRRAYELYSFFKFHKPEYAQ
jgi:hypothetical protein